MSGGIVMVLDSYVIYQSWKAARDMFMAMTYADIEFGNIHYIDDETAAANLEVAQLKSLAEASDEVM